MTPEDRSAANRRVAEFMGWHDEEYENVWQGGVDRYWRLIDHEGCRMEVACCSPEEAWASHNIHDLWADSPEGAAWRFETRNALLRAEWELDAWAAADGTFHYRFEHSSPHAVAFGSGSAIDAEANAIRMAIEKSGGLNA